MKKKILALVFVITIMVSGSFTISSIAKPYSDCESVTIESESCSFVAIVCGDVNEKAEMLAVWYGYHCG